MIDLQLGTSHGAVLATDDSTIYMKGQLRATGPANEGDVAFVGTLDCSGSMEGPKLEGARQAVRHVAHRMGPRHRLSLVRFSGEATEVFQNLGPADLPRIEEAVRGLDLEWTGTNVHAAIESGIQMAGRIPASSRKVLLLTDGLHNVPEDLPLEAFLELARRAARQGVVISTYGIGLDYDPDLLNAVANAAGGLHRYIADVGQMADYFTAEFDQAASLLARDVKLLLRVPVGVQIVEFVGFPASISPDGRTAEATVGAVDATDRVFTAQVRVAPGPEGPFRLARAEAAWTTPAGPGRAEARLLVRRTADLREVIAAKNVRVVQEARLGRLMAAASRGQTTPELVGKLQATVRDLGLQGTELATKIDLLTAGATQATLVEAEFSNRVQSGTTLT